MFIDEVKKKVGSDFDRLARLSIVEEDSTKVSFVMDGILELILSILRWLVHTMQMIRMANLAVVASHTVNGVSQMHSAYVKSVLLKVTDNHVNFVAAIVHSFLKVQLDS